MTDEQIRAARDAEVFELEDAIVDDETNNTREVLWISEEQLDFGIRRIENWLLSIQ